MVAILGVETFSNSFTSLILVDAVIVNIVAAVHCEPVSRSNTWFEPPTAVTNTGLLATVPQEGLLVIV